MPNVYTAQIGIDGKAYDVPLMTINRSWNFLDASAERTQTGDLYRELIGVFLTVDIEFGFIDDTATHDELFEKLAEPVKYHRISLGNVIPDFNYYVSGLKDNIRRIHDADIEYENLTCTFTSTAALALPCGDVQVFDYATAYIQEPPNYIGKRVWDEDIRDYFGTDSEDLEVTRGMFIDGIEIREPFAMIERRGETLDRYAARLRNGEIDRDIIGTYKNYSIQFGDMGKRSYDALMCILTWAVPFHTFKIPIEGGEYNEFTGYVANIKDSCYRITGHSEYFKNLQCDLIAKTPYLTPQ